MADTFAFLVQDYARYSPADVEPIVRHADLIDPVLRKAQAAAKAQGLTEPLGWDD